MDKLAQDLPRRLQGGGSSPSREETQRSGGRDASKRELLPKLRKGRGGRAKVKAFWSTVAVVVGVFLIWQGTALLAKRSAAGSAPHDAKAAENARTAFPPANADPKTKMEAA